MSDETTRARLRARIHGLVNHGLEICSEFVPQSDLPISCGRCGYHAETHDIRDASDLLAAHAETVARLEQALSLEVEMRRVEAIEHEAEVVRLTQERDAAQGELATIDAVMARRPALDKPTRRENIEYTIRTAAQADTMMRERDTARAALFVRIDRLEVLRAEVQRLTEALAAREAQMHMIRGATDQIADVLRLAAPDGDVTP